MELSMFTKQVVAAQFGWWNIPDAHTGLLY
jgi:hypothetical protein